MAYNLPPEIPSPSVEETLRDRNYENRKRFNNPLSLDGIGLGRVQTGHIGNT